MSTGDRNICTNWVAAAIAVNRGSPAAPLGGPAGTPDVARVLADPAYASGFDAVATLADSASDSALRGAVATLRTGLQTTASHGTLDQAAVVDALSTLTRRCLELGFPIPPVSSR